MTLVSTKEFNTNQDKYDQNIICEPDDDFRNSISWEDFRTRTRRIMQKYSV